mgnify:FL=1
MTPEGKVKKDVKALFAADGVHYTMPVSNGMGKMGQGDFIACVNGRDLSVETKAEGKKMTTLQELNAEKVRAAGGIAVVIRPGDLGNLAALVLAMKSRAPGVIQEYANLLCQ